MPEPQDNLRRAAALGFDAVDRQTAEQLSWLGAQAAGNIWRLPVLEAVLDVDLAGRRITTAAGDEIAPAWRILVLHYLAIAGRPEKLPPEITFADLPSARTYAGVYQQRAIARLCATAGRDAERLHRGAGHRRPRRQPAATPPSTSTSSRGFPCGPSGTPPTPSSPVGHAVAAAEHRSLPVHRGHRRPLRTPRVALGGRGL